MVKEFWYLQDNSDLWCIKHYSPIHLAYMFQQDMELVLLDQPDKDFHLDKQFPKLLQCDNAFPLYIIYIHPMILHLSYLTKIQEDKNGLQHTLYWYFLNSSYRLNQQGKAYRTFHHLGLGMYPEDRFVTPYDHFHLL